MKRYLKQGQLRANTSPSAQKCASKKGVTVSKLLANAEYLFMTT